VLRIPALRQRAAEKAGTGRIGVVHSLTCHDLQIFIHNAPLVELPVSSFLWLGGAAWK
jgi:hypothetical protein